MPTSPVPFEIVALSCGTYSLLFRALSGSRSSSSLSAHGRIKAISAGHATFTTIAAVYVLHSAPWKVTKVPANILSRPLTSDGSLDDSSNPMIQGRSALANALTAWEAGYLIYDTWALVNASASTGPSQAMVGAIMKGARTSPAIFTHHFLLASAFLLLQLYVAQNQERGLWVIVTFMLSNASTPVMHLRWWARQSGKGTLMWDLAFAVAFAAARFGTVAWILRKYGAYHGLTPWEAYKQLRAPCQLGTAALTGMNGLWWILLVRGIVRRNATKRKTV